MSTLITRLVNDGTFLNNGIFDEVTNQGSSPSERSNTVGYFVSGILDEVTYNSTAPLIKNLVTYSQDFTIWYKYADTTLPTVTNSTDILAPDGTVGVTKVVGNSSIAWFQPQFFIPYTAGNNYVFSVYVHAGTQSSIQILLYGGDYTNTTSSTISVTYDVSNQTMNNNSGAFVNSYGMDFIGNGWYRCWMNATCTKSGSQQHQYIRTNFQSGSIYFWGYQVEQVATTTSKNSIYQGIAAANTLVNPRFVKRIGNDGTSYVTNIFDEITGAPIVDNTLMLWLDAGQTASYAGPNTTFANPALMNGIATSATMTSVAVNSSGLFVAVGLNGNQYPVYATSTNGSTWTTPATMNGSTTAVYTMTSVAVNSSGLFVAVGVSSNPTNYPLYATSTNGSTWTTPATMNGSTTAARMTSVAVNSSGLFVAVGWNNSGYPVYATSTNGSTWTTPALMNGSTTLAQMTAVTVNSSGLFVAVGYNVNQYPVYATSTNGSTWTTPALMNGSTTVAQMTAVTVNSSGLFVAVGYDANTYPVYATSTNGSTWTTPATMNGSTNTHIMTSITVNSSGLFVAVGYDDIDIYPVYATSTNGSTWTTPAKIGTTAFATMLSVTVNSSGLFVAVGYDASNYAVYATSTNGVIWTDLSRTPKYYTLVGSPNYSSKTGAGVLTFNAANSAYTISTSTLFNSTTFNAYTISLWVYPKSSGNLVQVNGQATPNTGYHYSAIEISAAGVIKFGQFTGASITTIATSTQSLNAWYNLVITYDGTTAKSYVNGTSVGTSAIAWSSPGASTFMALMAIDTTNMGTGAYASGDVGTFMVYNRALSLDEVTINFNALRDRYGV